MLCQPGEFQSGARATSCLQCDYGKYSEGVGSTTCISCNATASTRYVASNSSTQCAAATYRVFSFGQNLHGQLGVGTGSEINYVASLFANDVGNPGWRLKNENVKSISVGFYHTLVVTEGLGGDRVFASGSNDFGELGRAAQIKDPRCREPDQPDGVCFLYPSFNPNPVEIPSDSMGSSGAEKKAYAGRHSSYVLTQGKLYSFGFNDYGQLGRTGSETRVLVGIGDVTMVAVGWYHVLAVTSDGALYAWGLNRSVAFFACALGPLCVRACSGFDRWEERRVVAAHTDVEHGAWRLKR